MIKTQGLGPDNLGPVNSIGVKKKDQRMTEQKILRDIEILENQVLITECSRLKRAWMDKLQALGKILSRLKK